MKSKTKLIYFLLVFISVFSLGRYIDSDKMMIPEFTAPYFSGAALLSESNEWQFNLSEVDSLHSFLSTENKDQARDKINSFRFSTKSINSRTYSVNQPGYLYVVYIAQNIFFWTGGIGAVKLLQLFVHALISLCILLRLKQKRNQILFFILYCINPLILYYALYPFYYFWVVIPSGIFIYIYLTKRKLPFGGILLISFALAFLFHIRSTVVLISILSLFLMSQHMSRYKIASVFIIYFLAILGLSPKKSHKHPGHILYTSLGAYPNAFVENFSDTVSWNAYSNYTGEKYSYTSSPGLYDRDVFFGESKWCLKEYKKIALDNPFMILKNALLNYLQCFSYGHIRPSITLCYISSILGFFFLLFLFYIFYLL